MDSLAQQLSQRVGLHLGADPLIRASDRADFQASGALAAAASDGACHANSPLRSRPPSPAMA